MGDSWGRRKPRPKLEERVANRLLKLLKRGRVSKNSIEALLEPKRVSQNFHSTHCPKNLKGLDCWIRTIEVLYNWLSPSRAILHSRRFKGAVQYFWLPHQGGITPILSPLRRDIRKALKSKNEADVIIAKLERVIPTKPLKTPDLILSPSLRIYAKQAARKHSGHTPYFIPYRHLAEWLFDSTNWKVLCTDTKYVPNLTYYSSKGGFGLAPRISLFDRPTSGEIKKWKSNGYIKYLDRIGKNIYDHMVFFYEDVASLKNPQMLMGAGGGKYTATVLEEAKKKLINYRKTWHGLLSITRKQHTLKNHIMISRDRGKKTFIKELWGDISHLSRLSGWRKSR